MATVRDLITGSLRLIGAIDPGEALDGQAALDALQALNGLIESMNLEHLLNPTGLNRVNVTTVPGQASYTIGTGGNFDTARPVAIDKAFVTLSGAEYEVEVVGDDEWAEIPLKSLQNIPTRLYYEPESPLGVVFLHPVPSAAFPLALWVWDALPTYTTVNTTLTLGPGYLRMLRYNLAVELAPEYSKEPSPVVVQIAMESKAAVKRANQITPLLGVDDALMQTSTGMGGGISSFLAG